MKITVLEIMLGLFFLHSFLVSLVRAREVVSPAGVEEPSSNLWCIEQ